MFSLILSPWVKKALRLLREGVGGGDGGDVRALLVLILPKVSSQISKSEPICVDFLACFISIKIIWYIYVFHTLKEYKRINKPQLLTIENE